MFFYFFLLSLFTKNPGTQYEIKHFAMAKIKKKIPDGDNDKKSGKCSTKCAPKNFLAREK